MAATLFPPLHSATRMATPAAAALFAAALSRPVAGAEASTSNHPHSQSGRGRARGRLSAGRGRGGRGRDSERDGDVGMDDRESGFKRRGRDARKASGPMGERPQNDRAKGAGGSRNGPAVIRDGGRRGTLAPPPSASAIETLRLFLLSRYSAADKMLNLENMAGDAMLLQAGLKAPGEKGAPANVAGACWKLAGSLFPEAVSLSLANNSLTTLLVLSPYLLTTHLPNLQNVSLAANSLNFIRDLDPLSPSIGQHRHDRRPKGWASLHELVLTGNPLVETGPREAAYRTEIARRFPTLRQLDQQPLDPSIAFASSAASTSNLTPGLSPAAKRDATRGKPNKPPRAPVVFPVGVKAGFFESEGTRDFVAGFLMKFFPGFDTDRPSLMAVYSPACSFSYFADTSYPIRARAKKLGTHGDKRLPNQSKLDWKLYLGAEGSRNLARVKVPEKRAATLQTTPSAVVNSICKLPATVHPLTDPTKFVFDTWTMPGMLAPPAPGAEGETVIIAVVHGEFSELPGKGVRSFDRTFVLAPAPPGSTAQLANWPCIILSDHLSVRGYSDPVAWHPVEPVVEAGPVVGSVAIAPGTAPGGERAEGLTDPQQAIVLQLQAHTKLTYSFAHLCLVQNGWDPARALENFVLLSTSGAIPPEAFLQ